MTETTADFDAIVQKALDFYGPNPPPEVVERANADLRMCLDNPGRYVAYLDDWDEATGALNRRVVATAATHPELWDATKGHPRYDEIQYDYMYGPDDGFDDAPTLPDGD